MWHCPHTKAESSCGTGAGGRLQTGQTRPCTSACVCVSFCQKQELHQPPHLLPTAGCLLPWGWGKQILLATGFSCSCRCCAWRSQSHARINVQSGGAGLMAGPHGFAPGLSGMVFADPGPSTGELPALCPPWQSPGTWEAGGTLPLGNTSARFPGNMKQSKSSPRHASPSSVAGGHRGELRGEQAEGNQNSFLQPSARFPKSFAALASEAAITQTCPLCLHEAAVLDAAPHFEVALLPHSTLKVH